MIDMTALSAHHGSPAAAAHMRRRHRAEFRMKLYGIAAILLAGAALATLLWSVVGKASLALSESYITLPVDLSEAETGLTAASDPAEIAGLNFGRMAKDALRDAFPGVKSRGDKRDLNGLISSGAPFELQAAVTADPSVLGGPYAFRFLASDDADLYLKGVFGVFDTKNSAGVVTPSGVEDTITLTSTAPDFTEELAAVKEALLDRARIKRNEARRQERGRSVFAERAEAETDADERAKLLAQTETYAAARDALEAEAEGLEARARAEGGEEALDDTLPSALIQVNGGWVKATRVSPNRVEGEVITPLDSAESASDWTLLVSAQPEARRKISDKQVIWIETLRAEGKIDTVFNKRFFTAGDSRDAELAGIWGAVVGSFWTMLVTFVLAFPIGVMAAIYLEEFSPRNRLVGFIEVNINNLAAVPSIIFGLLGLAVFLQFFGVPRSAPLAGGMVMALMTLPTIIIASRVAIAAVPPSIRDAALGLGASRMQTTFHHVLPLAMPGILTGAILGMARALGETAPLILIGMVAFIVDVPKGVTDSATVLPVQIYRWSDFPERAFEARTAAAICALLAFLIVMNGLAVFLRKQFERRW
jgi:phosphate transport system permease protein